MLQSEGAGQYLARVRRALPCMGGRKRRLLKKIREQLAIWEESCPSATYQNAVDRFGQPEQIAAAYVESADTNELLASLRIRGQIVRTFIAMALGIVLIWAAGVTAAVVDAKNSIGSYYTETIDAIEQAENFNLPEGENIK